MIRLVTRTTRAAIVAGASLLGGCADVPDAALPPHVDLDLRATYQLGDELGILVPFSRKDLTVFALEVKPLPSGETFAGGQRRLVFAPGTQAVEIRCQCRFYGSSENVRNMFPGATQVTRAQ